MVRRLRWQPEMPRRRSISGSARAVAASTLGVVLAIAPSARAFGGVVFGAGDAGAAVVAHRTTVARSDVASTMWDEVVVRGAPRDLAWIFPIRAAATYGVGRPEFADALDRATAVVVSPPPLQCSRVRPAGCGGSASTESYVGSGAGGDGGNSGEAAWSRGLAGAVLPPTSFETLLGADAATIATRLRAEGFALADADAAALESDARAGYGFVVARLHAPAGAGGIGPIRVSTRGALERLPVRAFGADAAGVEATLVLIDEGSVSPVGLRVATVDGADLRWDFAAARSDYGGVRAGLAGASPPSLVRESSDAIAASPLPAAAGRTFGEARQPAGATSPWWQSTDPPVIDASATDLELAFAGQARRRASRFWFAPGGLASGALGAELVLARDAADTVVPAARVAGSSTHGVCAMEGSLARARVHGAGLAALAVVAGLLARRARRGARGR